MTMQDRLTAVKNSAEEARRRVRTAMQRIEKGADPKQVVGELEMAAIDLSQAISNCAQMAA